MFRFNFELDGASEDETGAPGTHPDTPSTEMASSNDPCMEHDLNELVRTLPPRISYTPVSIPLPLPPTLKLARRDLFDARFQVIADTSEEGANSFISEKPIRQFIDAPSDLVPGLYEGGLKTWECSIDLTAYMHTNGINGDFILGKRVLELGCGTGLPSIYLIQRLFMLPPNPSSSLEYTVFYLQDYNSSVLQLVTLPNIILAWYFSPASATYRRSSEDNHPSEPPDDGGELSFDQDLIDAFLSSLLEYHLQLRFFSGDWSTFSPSSSAFPGITEKFEVILTSETIYRTASITPLISILKKLEPRSRLESPPPLTLVAAKILYFGVGGGVPEFVDAVQKEGGNARIEWESNNGVGRRILSIKFD